MSNVTNELMYEVLKSIQVRLDSMDRSIKDLAHGQMRVREDLNNFHRDTIRLEGHVAELSNRLERIERLMETVQIN